MTGPPESTYTLSPLGDRALVIELGNDASEQTARYVAAVAETLMTRALAGVLDVVPAVCTVAVHYDPMLVELAGPSDTPYAALAVTIAGLIHKVGPKSLAVTRPIDIPVCYGGAHGEDLENVAQAHGLSAQRLIELHCTPVYRVQMLGFAPGFAYLAGLDPRLATTRRTTPRTRVPAGSVAIGGELTGIYPFDLPGGWHVIGRTPLRMFDIGAEPPSRLRPGERVRFVPISEARYAEMEERR